MEHVCLASCRRVTDVGMAVLTALPALRRVTLSRCPTVSEVCPDCRQALKACCEINVLLALAGGTAFVTMMISHRFAIALSCVCVLDACILSAQPRPACCQEECERSEFSADAVPAGREGLARVADARA